MSDQPDKPEDDRSASAEPAMPEPELVTADDVHLADPDVSADAVEPSLNTSAAEVRLNDPSLGPAEISEDAAEAASLDAVAAEAEQVAQEAEDVGTLVAGPRPAEDPAEAATPSGTAPAGGTAGDTASTSGTPAVEAPDSTAASHEAGKGQLDGLPGEGQLDGLPAGIPAPPAAAPGERAEETQGTAQADAAEQVPEDGETPSASNAPIAADEPGDGPADQPADPTAPEAPWAQPFPAQHPHAPGGPVPPVGGPYGLPPAGPNDPAPTRIRARSAERSSRGSNRKILIVLGVAGLVVLTLLIFAITAIASALRTDDADAGTFPGTTPGADGIIADNISPLELAAGACILGFNPTELNADVTTVTCTTPHNAQLLATTSFPAEAEFPGQAALNASGDDLCNSVAINEEAAAEYSALTLTQVTPTARTWADGDRRIDCFVVSEEGDAITDTLLAE